MKTMWKRFVSPWLLTALLLCTAGTSAMAATPDEDIRPIRTDVTISGVVESDYTDGLLVTADDGTSYLVLTPDAVTLEQEEAFHKRFKGRQVSLTGNLYHEEDGTMSLYVSTLPKP